MLQVTDDAEIAGTLFARGVNSRSEFGTPGRQNNRIKGCVKFGATFYFFGDDSSESYIPVSPEVEVYSPVIQKYCKEYGIPQFAELVKAVMMQESGGNGTVPMQTSEFKYNTK